MDTFFFPARDTDWTVRAPFSHRFAYQFCTITRRSVYQCCVTCAQVRYRFGSMDRTSEYILVYQANYLHGAVNAAGGPRTSRRLRWADAKRGW